MTEIRKKSRLNRATGWDAVIFIALTLIAILIFLPFYNAVVISLETNRAYALNPVSMYPVEFTLRNYEHLIEKGQIGVGYRNTIFITFAGTVLSMFAMVAMAYAFSRKRFPGKKFFFLLMMFTMFFSGGMIPTYLQFKNLGLINSVWAIILYSGVSAYNIIILKNGFEQTPPELYSDIVENGIFLSGGGALLRGLDKRLTDKVNIPFHVAEDPLRAVARGTCIALKNPNYPFLMR